MIRRSVSVTEAAEMVSTSRDTILRMLETGELAGHYWRREKRVFLDSLADYQNKHMIAPAYKPMTSTPERPRRRQLAIVSDVDKKLKEFGL